jgi:hypothetical protein
MADMSVQPMHEFDPDDVMEIMGVLPARYHEQFLADYDAAAASARRPGQYRQLHLTLRLWRRRAAAFSDPGFRARLGEARGGTPIQDVVPDWAGRVEAARRRMPEGELPGQVRGQGVSSAPRAGVSCF